jgi:hypothetical protein
LFDKRGREGQKSMWGIVALVPRLPASIVEQAATIAIAQQISSYKAVRLIAEQLLAQAIARLEADTAPPLTQQHELIREPTEYAEFFRQRADALNP